MPEFVLIGGPNGAGKTTAAQHLLPAALGIREFVNADEIARGLSPFNPEGSAIAAGRLAIERAHALAASGTSFGMESTCSGRSHARMLQRFRALGYRLSLLFLWLPTAQAALDRVARRVREGGHHVPAEIVVRRYRAGARNLSRLYLPLAELALIYDNSGTSGRLIAERHPGEGLIVHDDACWRVILEAAQWPR